MFWVQKIIIFIFCVFKVLQCIKDHSLRPITKEGPDPVECIISNSILMEFPKEHRLVQFVKHGFIETPKPPPNHPKPPPNILLPYVKSL